MARSLTQPQLDEIARRGEDIYERAIRQAVEDGNLGRYVAIIGIIG